MDYEIKILEAIDVEKFKLLLRVFSDAFQRADFIPPDDSHLRSLLQQKDLVVMIASANERVLGGLTAYVLNQYYSIQKVAYIFDFAVAKAYQRQGIGRALMAEMLAFCKSNGFAEAFVQASRDDQHAIDFYQATGGSAEDAVHFTYQV